MASASDGWPQFIKTFDEWRERKPQRAPARGSSAARWMPGRARAAIAMA